MDDRRTPLPTWLQDPLPAGFTMCGSCGFDHVLEEVEAKRWHATDLHRLMSMELALKAFTPAQRLIVLRAHAVKRWRNVVLDRHAHELWAAVTWAQAHDANRRHDKNRAIVGEWSNEIVHRVSALSRAVTSAFFTEVRRDLKYDIESV